ncbi:MAG TPA: translation initiation factor IF-2 [Thermoguttaceae bacterium]|nr:translation initiation factor IF-2 [Thermoguttaceae bacterium]
MPVRIYALAKQLNLDSKALVDICNEAGVTGKGSALANLTEEEVEKVKAYVSSRGRATGPSRAALKRPSAGPVETADVVRREDYIGPGSASGGKIPVLPARRDRSRTPVGEEIPEGIASATEQAEEAVTPVVSDETSSTAEATLAAPPDGPVRPPLTKSPPPPGPRKRTPRPPSERTGPTIKLAPIPTAQQPAGPPKAQEPAAQKPDLRLPRDAIRAGRLGEKPLAKHIEDQEQKRKAAKKKGPAAKDATANQTQELALPSAGRGRRGKGHGPAEAPAEEGTATLGGREQRQLKRKRGSSHRRKGDEEEETKTTRRVVKRIRRIGTNTAAPRKHNVVLELPCTVRTFSEAVGVPAGQVLGKLLAMGAGAAVNINAAVEVDTAELLAAEFGVEVDFRRSVGLEEQVLTAVEQEEDDSAMLQPRPPIITFLGHVDHGKTSLLDRILGIDVVSGEKGGITQHIRAYQIEKDGHAIAFVDTPGHAAFTEMRARGANVTDIAVLVVAADDGIMPQTEEAISHARAAGVPIVVALNKIDLPGVNTQRTYEQLAANELLPSEWGGETEVVKTSATTGEGVDTLLETLLTVAELHEYRANPDRPGFGTCLESSLHEGLGVVAKLLVQQGTLHVGDVVVCGTAHGRVKAMYDTLDLSRRYTEAGPSMPVNVTGLDLAPGAGDRFHVVPEITQAREIAESRAQEAREHSLSGGQTHVTLENLFDHLGQAEVQTLNIVLRADVRGSIEALRKELSKLEHPEVQLKIIQATVGGITEADVHLADASNAVIIGFNVVPDEGARQLADRCGVQIRRYDIIYQVADDLRAALEGMLKPEKREAELGRVLIQRVFQISRVGTIAGCRVLAGTVQRDARARLIRENRVIGEYPLESLKREKDDAREVREGYECGIKLRGFNDLKEGDILEVYKIEEVARTL